jgi:biotin transport system substrate-specific component
MTASAAEIRFLARRVVRGEGFLWDALRILIANALLVLCAKIAIPLPWTPVPVTGQTFAVMLVAAWLGSRRGLFTLVLYLLEGAAGLPVFQPWGLPGPAHFFGPTAGYLLAFPLAAFLIGWAVERGAARRLPLLLAALLGGEAVIFLGGCACLALFVGMDWNRVLFAGVWPFLPGELIKLSLAVVLIRAMQGAASGAAHRSV